MESCRASGKSNKELVVFSFHVNSSKNNICQNIIFERANNVGKYEFTKFLRVLQKGNL